jgi:hypothetical protein
VKRGGNNATRLGDLPPAALKSHGGRGCDSFYNLAGCFGFASAGGQRTFFPEGRAWEPQANFDVPVAMLSRAETYEKKAAECEREGDRAATPVLKSKYRGVAQQWREMAEQERRSAVSRRPKKFVSRQV